jgi:hypothetical protein
MPAFTFKARSTTELLDLRAREQPNDPAIYTGTPADEAIQLRFLTFVNSLTSSFLVC